MKYCNTKTVQAVNNKRNTELKLPQEDIRTNIHANIHIITNIRIYFLRIPIYNHRPSFSNRLIAL